MNRFSIIFVGTFLAASVCSAQTPVAPGQIGSALGHGSFPVKVVKTLDSSKLKGGESIEVETVGSFKLPDGTLIPKGSRLLGRVALSKARAKGDPDSQLTLSFEKLNAGSGKQLSVKGAVQAVYPPAEEPMGPNMSTAGTSAGGSGGGGPSGGVGLTDTTSGSNTQSPSRAQPVMNMSATGVTGIDNLQLDNGLLTSKAKSVKLSGGVRMIVYAEFLGWSGLS